MPTPGISPRPAACGSRSRWPRFRSQPGVEEVAGGAEGAYELAAAGGEDFELLASIPPQSFDEARAAVEKTGVALTAIGIVGAGSGVVLRAPSGSTLEATGFDHLA